jgi:hypothetical protein
LASLARSRQEHKKINKYKKVVLWYRFGLTSQQEEADVTTQKRMTYSRAVACQCGLDAAVVLQWLEERQTQHEAGWVPRSTVHGMVSECPFISPTSVVRLIPRLRAAGLIEAQNRGNGRSGERLHYRVRQAPLNLVASAATAAAHVPAAEVARLIASAEDAEA